MIPGIISGDHQPRRRLTISSYSRSKSACALRCVPWRFPSRTIARIRHHRSRDPRQSGCGLCEPRARNTSEGWRTAAHVCFNAPELAGSRQRLPGNIARQPMDHAHGSCNRAAAGRDTALTTRVRFGVVAICSGHMSPGGGCGLHSPDGRIRSCHVVLSRPDAVDEFREGPWHAAEHAKALCPLSRGRAEPHEILGPKNLKDGAWLERRLIGSRCHVVAAALEVFPAALAR